MQVNTQIIQNYKDYLAKKFKEQDKQKIAGSLYIIFSLFTVSIFGFFAINPALSTVSNLKKQYADDQVVLSALTTKVTSLDSLNKQYVALGPDLFYIDSAIPSSAKIAYLTRQIENLAASYNLNLKNLDFNTIELFPLKNPNSPFYSFTFNLQIEGEEKSVREFISDLINLDRLISVERMTFNKSEEGFSSANIVGKAFFINE